MTRTIEFVITNPRHHLAMFAPVIRWLRGHSDSALRVVSLCELRGYPTPVASIAKAGAEAFQIMPIRLSKDSAGLRAAREHTTGPRRKFLQGLVWYALVRWDVGLRRRRAPGLAVVPNDHVFPYDRIVRAYARNSIPYVLMQEGIRFDLPSNAVRWAYGTAGARAIAAWGPSSVRYFRDAGVPESRIHVVGNPRLDDVLQSDWGPASAALQSRLDLGPNVLVFLSNPIDRLGFVSTEAKYRLFGDFLDAARAFLQARQFQLAVKIHPAESLTAYRAVADASSARDQVRVVRDAELYPLLHLAKGAVILGSTVGLEALLFDLPLGVVEIPGVGTLYDFVDAGVALKLRPDDGLSERLGRLVDSQGVWKAARAAYLNEQIANLGRSAEVAGRLILEHTREVTSVSSVP